jgi:hypothetical protein
VVVLWHVLKIKVTVARIWRCFRYQEQIDTDRLIPASGLSTPLKMRIMG